jgi:target of rapamycin complex subunit LST8
MSSAVVLATAGYDRTIRYWEATTGVCSKTVKYDDSQINDLAITQDKKWLAAATNGKIQVFDTLRESVAATLEAHAGNVMSIGFAKDSRWICSGSACKYGRLCTITMYL